MSLHVHNTILHAVFIFFNLQTWSTWWMRLLISYIGDSLGGWIAYMSTNVLLRATSFASSPGLLPISECIHSPMSRHPGIHFLWAEYVAVSIADQIFLLDISNMCLISFKYCEVFGLWQLNLMEYGQVTCNPQFSANVKNLFIKCFC